MLKPRRRILAASLGAAFVASLFGAVCTFGVCAEQQPAAPPALVHPKAQELLHRTIQALGGSAFLSFKTLTTRGRIFSIAEESTVGLAVFQSSLQYPDKRRFSYGKDKPVILINNGDAAWELDRYGLIRQPPEQAQRWKITNRYSLENLLRLRIVEPEVLIQEGGVDFVDNVPTQGVEILEVRGTQVKLDLNRQTLLPIRISYRVKNPKTEDWDEYADVYGDYKNFQGIQTPMHITRFLNGERVSEIFRNSARYDESYPSDYFAPPG